MVKKIGENFDNNIMIILFGNKADIEKEKRQVLKEEIEQFVKEKNLIYFETSAKTGQGINEGFSYIVNKAYDNIIFKNDEVIKLGEKKDNDDDDYIITVHCIGRRVKRRKIKNKF